MSTLAINGLLAFDLPPFLGNYLGVWVGLAIVVIGLVGVGLSDLSRFSPSRVWAISGVCFDESIRRRILWITPIAILGVLAVTQLQKATDEQDAIRQTTKFCLFATGLVVVISVLILACTNLPREIDNRVIYTIVTKPTTRLEIVLGKIIGFARVSALILLIMGLFTWGYLHLRAHSLQADIRERLAANAVEPISRSTLEHYIDPTGPGLLNARTLAMPTSTNIYAKLPAPNDPRRWFGGSSEGSVLVPFVLPPDAALRNPDASAEEPGLALRLTVGFESTASAAVAAPAASSATSRPFTGPAPLVASTRPVNAAPTADSTPKVQLEILDPAQNTVLVGEINGGQPYTLTSPLGNDLTAVLPNKVVSQLGKMPFFYVAVLGVSPNSIFSVAGDFAHALVPVTGSDKPVVLSPADPQHPSQPGVPIFKGRSANFGQQLKGGPADTAPVCVLHYANTPVRTAEGGSAPIQLRVTIENSSETYDVDKPTEVQFQVIQDSTGKVFDAGEVRPENNRAVFGSLPAEAVADGNFDVLVRCLSPNHFIGLTDTSVEVVRAENSFALNLFKSLLVIWLLSVLVVSISIFCSTFLSWPIAVVLTLVLLLGHWGVEELGDAASAGLGRQFVQDFGVRDPAQAQALSTTVEQLNKALTTVSVVLPDINNFSATDEIERGINISFGTLLNAALVLFGFGIPLTVLAYVFLKNKEVAP